MTYLSEVLADAPLAYYRVNDAAATTYTSTFASSSVGGEVANNAFNGSATAFWTTGGTSSGHVGAQTAAGRALTSYAIRRRNDIPARNPKDWTFQGSNDGSSWTTLDTRSGVTWPTADEIKRYEFTNSTSYTHYRLNVSANNGDTYLSVNELIMPAKSGAPLAQDYSGNHRHGTYVLPPTYGAPGLLVGDTDLAATWNGSTDSRIEVSHGAWMDAAAFSVTARIKLSSLTGVRTIASRYNRFILRVNAGKLELTIRNTGDTAWQTVTMSTQLTLNQAYSVGFSYTGGAAKVYLDGVEVLSASGWTVRTTTSLLLIGSLAFSGEMFAGVLDEVAFYGTALSGARFAALHLAADPDAEPPAPPPKMIRTAATPVGVLRGGEKLRAASTRLGMMLLEDVPIRAAAVNVSAIRDSVDGIQVAESHIELLIQERVPWQTVRDLPVQDKRAHHWEQGWYHWSDSDGV